MTSRRDASATVVYLHNTAEWDAFLLVPLPHLAASVPERASSGPGPRGPSPEPWISVLLSVLPLPYLSWSLRLLLLVVFLLLLDALSIALFFYVLSVHLNSFTKHNGAARGRAVGRKGRFSDLPSPTLGRWMAVRSVVAS